MVDDSFLSVMETKALRGAFGAAGVAINLDEAVGEIHGLVVLHPIDIELDPVVVFAGLVVADRSSMTFCWAGLGVGAGLGEKFVGFGRYSA